ncbi:MAG: FAD-dependent oxidoreductase, partial [Pirellulaceae bacterium]
MNGHAIDRRQFAGAVASLATIGMPTGPVINAAEPAKRTKETSADVVIVGGSLGGCAAAIAALRNGLRVVLTEETDWIGGQLTSQAVPPDEHRWIETHGANASYRRLRSRIRDYYRRHYPLTDAARQQPNLNPGNGTVSRLCHEPRVALAVLRDWLAPYISSGQLQLFTECKAIGS